MLCLLFAFVLTDPAPPMSPAKRHKAAVAEAARKYLDGWESVTRSARNMEPERARQYLALNHAELTRAYTRDNGVTPKELARAVAELEKTRAAAKPAAPAPAPAGPSSAGERIAAAKPGALGVLEKGSLLARDYTEMSEAAVSLVASDFTGIDQQMKAGKLARASAPTQVRVLEVFDHRATDAGVFVRVRFNEGPNAGKDGYCFPKDVEFRAGAAKP